MTDDAPLPKSVLADAGHQTFSAATTQEALSIVEANAVSIDILFVDIGLALDEAAGAVHPGIELAKQAVARRPDLTVLYTTGQGVTNPSLSPTRQVFSARMTRVMLLPLIAFLIRQARQCTKQPGRVRRLRKLDDLRDDEFCQRVFPVA